MKEPNRDQIMKGLECCYSNSVCDGCPYIESVVCIRELERDALSLIKELTEKNKAISERYAIQVVTAIELDKQVQKLTDENERLKGNNEKS